MAEYIWSPKRELIEQANVTRLMRKLGYVVPADKPDKAAEEARSFVRRSQKHIGWFWQEALADLGLAWSKPYSRVLDTSRGHAWADWFIGGETNIAINCVDRWAESGPLAGDQGAADRTAYPQTVALIAETEDGQVRSFTFGQLNENVCRVANALKACGVQRGDCVACYMPMVAEVVFAMLATQKIGAIFVPIFSGYAPPAVRERLEDADVKVLFTADGSMRRGQPFSIKEAADEAVKGLACVKHVIVYERLRGASHGSPQASAKGNPDREDPPHEISLPSCPMLAGRDYWWSELVGRQLPACPTESMPALAPALMIYTSGTTGKPKGTVHTHAGCLAQMSKELAYNFDVRRGDIFWWFSDIGWMMGPWEIIGCFFHGVTLVVFEGAPNFPNPDRVWEMVERHRVTHLGISPTAVRMLIRAGNEWADKHPMPTLRMLGSTGEPWDPESYMWFFEHIGKGRCPIINISGGTDIVGCFLAPLPIMPLKAASLQSPGLGMDIDVFNEEGKPVIDEVGYLVCKQPAPSMTRSLWKNDAKYLETYWSKFPEVWNHGDWAKVDKEGDWFLFGRADDTLKIAGRRVGPGEIEAALIEHPAVSEAAAIGVPDKIKGQDVVCFVVLHRGRGYEESENLRKELIEQVVAALGKVDRPKNVLFVDDLPKTRSAKILRRLIQKKHLGEQNLGDLSSVANPDALEAVAKAR
ncbi:AMP-dependent synthetase [bacterium]|nr:MAG: AMP-dependent synthetase [bacterium]RIK59441.1 MAG: AMP-dependent synthetase [Planctomycetota bacterium]